MKNLDIVITMGGLGTRFRKMGYNMPKYMIEAKNKTLFEWSMISLEGFKNIAATYIFIAMRDKEYDVEEFIKNRCKNMEIYNPKIIIIDYLTDGQATTALLANQYWNMEHGLLVYNIDTYVETGELNSTQLKGDGFIPCFKAEGCHWSFVRLNEDGEVVEICEKKRISDNCTIGAYYFRSCKLYSELYDEFYCSQENNKINGEKYIAPLYNYLLQKQGLIYINNISVDKVHVLGTPEELYTFLNS